MSRSGSTPRPAGSRTAELTLFVATDHTVGDTLDEVLRVLEKVQRRLGARLFKDFLALHFTTKQPSSEAWSSHPFVAVEVLLRAGDRGEIPAEVDVVHRRVSLLVGLSALLITMPEDRAARSTASAAYLTNDRYGLRIVASGR